MRTKSWILGGLLLLGGVASAGEVAPSADQVVGSATRFPSLTIGSEGGIHGGCQMCWTRSGSRGSPSPVPART